MSSALHWSNAWNTYSLRCRWVAKSAHASSIRAPSGFRRFANRPYLAHRGGCWFERDELKIHLGADTDFNPARRAHPALLVEGLRELAEKLRRLGYEVQPDERLEGYARIYVHDPFGNRIELMEPLTHNSDVGPA
jgi:catechol 2,3-dioxygenase-like lactoylglutathione lyase family enzyme